MAYCSTATEPAPALVAQPKVRPGQGSTPAGPKLKADALRVPADACDRRQPEEHPMEVTQPRNPRREDSADYVIVVPYMG